MGRRIMRLCVAFVALGLVACAATAPGSNSVDQAIQPAPPVRPRTLAIGFNREVAVLDPGMLPQARVESGLMTAFLAIVDGHQQTHPYLAAELPSIEKGSWKILTDGPAILTFHATSVVVLLTHDAAVDGDRSITARPQSPWRYRKPVESLMRG